MRYLYEFAGTVILIVASLMTEMDPIIMGVVYAAVIFIGKQGGVTGFYSPGKALARVLVKQISYTEALYDVLIQVAAILAGVMVYRDIVPVLKLEDI
jgi:hypothetical protein